MLSPAEYAALDAHDLMHCLRRGDVSARELQTAALRAIDALDPQLNFMVSRTESADAEPAPGTAGAAFHGLPFLVKAGAGVRGQPMDASSRLAAGLSCTADSELVRRLRAAGVAILGSTNAPEFGSSPTTESLLHGPARNPWNPMHSCGGSSGGASAAVAAGVVPVAQSSDGGGSIRTPAHCCGVFGLKPSRGRTPLGPGSNGAIFGIGVSHVTTRSVRDSAAFLDLLAGDEPGALFTCAAPQRPFAQEVRRDAGRLRIGLWSTSPSRAPIDADCARAVDEAARLCDRLGHRVEPVEPLLPWEAFAEAMLDLWCMPFALAIDELRTRSGRQPGPDTLETSTWLCWQHAQSLSANRIERSVRTMHAIVRDLDLMFEHFDVVLSPVDLRPAPRLGDIDANRDHPSLRAWFDEAVSGFCPHTPLYNFAGQPAMAVPWTLSASGLPVGVQFAACRGAEATLLRLAAQLEAEHPWAQRRPAIHAAMDATR